MPPKCIVQGCPIQSYEILEKYDQKVTLYRFPKDIDQFNLWISKCGEVKSFNVNNSRICSLHFRESDFERDFKHELLGTPLKLTLKKDAFPSLNLPENEDPDLLSSTIHDESEESADSNLVEKLREQNSQLKKCVEEQSVQIEQYIEKESADCTRIKVLEEQNSELRKCVQDQSVRIKEYMKKIHSLQVQRNVYKAKSEKLHKCNCLIYKNAAVKMFTPAQLNLILNKRVITRWSPEDIAKAFTLRYLSERSYNYVRTTLKYPLPGLSTLRMWASKINMREGLLTSVLKFLEVAGSNMTPEEKVVVLQFGEMRIHESYEYDIKFDQVVGPHSRMQVINARGLFGKWNQPVFVGFDTKVTASILHSIINELYEINFKVVACVCGSGDDGVWKELGITYEKVFIKHQKTGDNVFFFADAPHSLKLIRNWLLDSEFEINGGKINKEPLVKLINECGNKEISSCFKLTDFHLSCEGAKRENVSLAAQLLSHSTAAALKRFYPNDCVAKQTADFIELTNNWFDIMNSRIPKKNSVEINNAYGLDLNNQNDTLNEMYEIILNLKCKNKKFLQPFQKGILLSINSLKLLFEEMQAKYNIKNIVTHRLNLDSLENLFCQIRTRGGLNDHPTPLQALQRLRLIILGKFHNLQTNVNTIEQSTDEYVIGKVLKECNFGQSVVDSQTTSTLSENPEINEDNESNHKDNEINTTSLCENDGINRLAGWIAKKLISTHPHLGDCSHNVNTEHDYMLPPRYKELSYGGLVPTEDFNNIVKILDCEFLKYMGDGIKNDENIVKKLEKKIKESVNDVDGIIIKHFVKQRLFMRINFLNKKYSVSRNNKVNKKEIIKRKTSEVKKNVKRRKIEN